MDYSCCRSRGAWLTASINSDVITQPQEYEISTFTKLKADIASLKEQGAVEIYIEGGFDGADSVYDLNECHYDPWVSEWGFELEI